MYLVFWPYHFIDKGNTGRVIRLKIMSSVWKYNIFVFHAIYNRCVKYRVRYAWFEIQKET